MTSKSFINKLYDSCKFDIHRSFRREIINIKKNNLGKNYDYGNGYFYQSFEKINLSGLRQTKKRVEVLNLNKVLTDKTVLDIGTNTGFLLMQTSVNFKKCIAIDWELSNILVAKKTQQYLNIKNILFLCENYTKYNINEKFDIVLSLANHTTFDGGIQNYKDYFSRLINNLSQNGILIFESHHPEIESKNKLDQIINYLLNRFTIIEHGSYNFNNYADDGRFFFILKKII